MLFRVPAALLATVLSTSVWATDDDFIAGLDTSMETVHQSFADSDADLLTVLVSPYAQWGNWEVRADLPWQRIEGEYFVNGAAPRAANLCEIAHRFPRFTGLLERRGVVTDEQLNECNTTETGTTITSVDDQVSGLSDITLYLSYLLPLDSEGLWGFGATLGYKLANGDEETGLGSDTRDTLTEFSVSGNFDVITAIVSTGYAFVSAEESATGYSDYAYASMDLGWHPLDWLSAGARMSHQGAGAEYLDDVKSYTGYVGVFAAKVIGLRVFVTGYGDTSGYPDQEYGANISYSF